MANPTSNFGWQMPTATDLVTDLPADFEVFGQAVDTDFVDLLGGTTGQILSKTSATDLDFTWINNDQGDITAVTTAAGSGLIRWRNFWSRSTFNPIIQDLLSQDRQLH
jgi:hypothetical protein